MVAVGVTPCQDLRIGDPTRLFQIPDGMLLTSDDYYARYDVGVDNQRFMMLRTHSLSTAPPVIPVLNWLDEARALLGS